MNHSISTVSGKTKLKAVLLGNQNVGKSSIIERYIHDRFEDTANPTVGIDFLAKNLSHAGRSYRLQLWDTAGQERFRALIPSYLKDAHCGLIVFDVAARATLNDAAMWAKMYAENRGSDGFLFLVGNKADLDFREVSSQEGSDRAAQLGMPYFEISAKTGDKVQDLFISLIEHSQQAASPYKLPKEAIKEEPEQQPKIEETGAKLAKPEDTVVLGPAGSAGERVQLKVQAPGIVRKSCC